MAVKESESPPPPEGKTTIDDKMFFEPERLGYVSAAAVAEKIAAEVASAVAGRVVVIAGARLLADLANLQTVYFRLKSLRDEYATLSLLTARVVEKRSAAEAAPGAEALSGVVEMAAAITAAASPVGAAVQAALGLVSFLREDVEYHGIKTEVDALAFEIALADRIKARGAASVFVPDLMIMNVTWGGPDSLLKRLEQVQAAKADAWKLVGPLVAELVRLEADLDIAVRDKEQLRVDYLTAEISKLRRDLQPVSDPLSRADRNAAELQARLNEADDSGLTTLARLLRAEVISSKSPRYVHARVISSGGHHRISRNLFRMLFLGDGLSFAGGATVRWALLDSKGAVEKGGILVERRCTSALGGQERAP